MNKEEKIQKAESILQIISEMSKGLSKMYEHYDGYLTHDNKLMNLSIADGETEDFLLSALQVKDSDIEFKVKKQYNKFVALLEVWHNRKSIELHKLLTDK